MGNRELKAQNSAQGVVQAEWRTMTDPNVVWFRARDQLWRGLVKWWPKKKLDSDFPKMPLAEELATDVLQLVHDWLPNDQLLVDVRRKLLEVDEHHLAERVTVALIQAQIARGRPTVEPEPTPEWYLWLMERVWMAKPEHNPKHLVLRLRILANQIEARARNEGYEMDRQMKMEFRDPARPF